MKTIIIGLACIFLAESAQIGPFPGDDNSLWTNDIKTGPSEGVAFSILFNQMRDGSFEGGPFSKFRPKCADKSKPTCVCDNGKVIIRPQINPCGDFSKPTCTCDDGSRPERQSPCKDGRKPVCEDGNLPLCGDGSTPNPFTFRPCPHTPPRFRCADGSKISCQDRTPLPFPLGDDKENLLKKMQERPFKEAGLSVLSNKTQDESFEGGPFSRLRPKCVDKSRPTWTCADGTIILRPEINPCGDWSKPTGKCADGSKPDRKSPCKDGRKPVCEDGNLPLCADGSKPDSHAFRPCPDTPPRLRCDDGGRLSCQDGTPLPRFIANLIG